MMNDMVYQAIYNEIEPLLPKDWDKLIIYLEYGIASYSMAFYVGKKDNMIKCYDLANVSEEKIMNTFDRIDKIVSPMRDALKKDKWSNMTIVVNDNSFKADFDYTDLSSGSYKYKKGWKKKYIG
jgi:hypothetical protein